MNIIIATKQAVNSSSVAHTITGLDSIGEEFYGVKDGDTVYVTEMGPAGENDLVDEQSVSQHKPVYMGYSIDKVKSNLELV